MALGIGTRRKALSGGNTPHGPLYTRTDIPGTSDIISEVYRGSLRARCDEFDDFNGAAINTTDGFWSAKIVGTTPTVALVASSTNGEVKGTLASNPEPEVAGLFTNDQLFIDSTKGFCFECRAKVSAAALSTRFVFGLASAYNAAFDSITRNAWFRVEGSSSTVYIEADDNTTDTNLQSTGYSLTAGTYNTFTIDGADLSAIRFYIDGNLVGTLNASAMSGNLQPFIAVQKDTGNGTQSWTCDYVRVSWNRL